jgi:hypothetical protein
MNHQEVAALLGLISARDGRAIGQVEVEAWHEDLGRWDFATARQAVARHYASSRDFARPFDVIKMIRAIREERLVAAGQITPPPELADNPAAEIAWVRNRREAIAAGRVPPTDGGEALLGRKRHELADQVKALASSKAIPTGPVPARPTATTVDPQRAAEAEAERARQLDALGQMTGGGS